MKNTLKLIEAIRSIAIIALVAIIGFTVLSCGEDDPIVLTEEQEEFKADILEMWEEGDSDERDAFNNAFRLFGLPPNPPSWSNSSWVKLSELSEADISLLYFVAEQTFYWNTRGTEWKADWEAEIIHYKDEHGLSDSISNDPNDWTKAQAEEVFATWIDCYINGTCQ